MTGRYQLTEDPDRFPRPFGSYLLLSPLGKGGMGEVFLAKRRTAAGPEVCVVKMLRADLSKDREYVMRFVDEANIVVRLQHKNICHVFDVGKTPQGQIYLAMEYLSGVDAKLLADRAAERGKGVAPAAAVQIGIDVLEALHHAHTRKDKKTGELLQLIHRDVSPHNVVVGFEGVSKLIDFGLASSTIKMEQTAPNVVMGKMAYMGPEQARGDSIDATADQFAAAMILYELLAGERFYEGLTPNEIWNTVGRGGFRPRKFKTIDRGLRNILDKAMHKSAAKRYATCQDMRDALATYQERTFPVGGPEAVRAELTELAGPELDDEWERMAGFSEVSLSGFTHELERHDPAAQTIAQAKPGSGPVREGLPPPRKAGPADPTAIIHEKSVTGSGRAEPARGHGAPSGEAHESTERLTRKRPAASGSGAHARNRTHEATEVVRSRASGDGPAEAAVVVVRPSQAHAAQAANSNKALLVAVGGGLGLLVVLLGGLAIWALTADDDPPNVASTDAPASTATGVKQLAPADDEVDATDDAPAADDDPPEIDDNEGAAHDDAKARASARADRRARKKAEAERTKEKARQAEEAAEARAAAERAAAERAAADKAELEAQKAVKREEHQARIDEAEQLLADKGYTTAASYPRAVRAAHTKAKANLDNRAAADKLVKLAKRQKPRPDPKPRTTTTPRAKASAPATTSAGGSFDFKGRLRHLAKQCLSKTRCARSLAGKIAQTDAIEGSWSPQARSKLAKDIEACERECGLR